MMMLVVIVVEMMMRRRRSFDENDGCDYGDVYAVGDFDYDEYYDVFDEGRTRVVFEGERNIVVNASDERKIQFTCKATSDPSTPPIVRWYKVVNNKEELVYDDPPDIIVKNGVLNISFNTNNTRRWTDYKEEFRCIAENGYSKDMAQVNITVLETMPPGEIDIRLRFQVLLRVCQTASFSEKEDERNLRQLRV